MDYPWNGRMGPVILLDHSDLIRTKLERTAPTAPSPDFQWIEDRFWTWIHYGLLKIGRGEYFEALDFMGFLRQVVFGPLLLYRNHALPRGMRKVETLLESSDLEILSETLSLNDQKSLLAATKNAIEHYKKLREELFKDKVSPNLAEEPVIRYFKNKIDEGSTIGSPDGTFGFSDWRINSHK